MSKTRLVIKTAEVTPEGILIRSMAIIDGETGNEIRIAKLTPELLDYLKVLEFDVDAYFAITAMQKKNPALKKLCQEFKLYT